MNAAYANVTMSLARNNGWAARVSAAQPWLYWFYGIGVLVWLVGAYLRLQSSWPLAPLFVAASSDIVLVGWKVVHDKESATPTKLLLGVLTAIGAVLARSLASGMLAKALGTDANVAPHTKDLLTVLYIPLCIAGILSLTLLVLVLGVVGLALFACIPLAIANAIRSAFGELAEPLRKVLDGLAKSSASTRQHAPVVVGSQARTGKPVARNLLSRLGRHVREQFNWLRLAVGGFLAILAPWSLFASLQNPRHLNALMLVTTWLDFRSAGECAGLENQRFQIASLPNVDTEVIVARCVVGACDLPVLRLVVMAPSTDKLVSFTREECRRRVTPHEAPSSKHAGPVDAGQAADAGSAPACDSVPTY